MISFHSEKSTIHMNLLNAKRLCDNFNFLNFALQFTNTGYTNKYANRRFLKKIQFPHRSYFYRYFYRRNETSKFNNSPR